MGKSEWRIGRTMLWMVKITSRNLPEETEDNHEKIGQYRQSLGRDSNPELPYQLIHVLWNPKADYRAHKNTPLDLILNQFHPVHKLTVCFLKICYNTIHQSTFCSRKLLSHLNSLCISHIFHACYIPRPSHPPWFDHPNNIWWSIHVTKLLIMHSSQVSLPLRSKYSPQHPVLKHPQSMFLP